METNNTIEALLKKQVRKEAMKKISSDFALTNEMLHRYWHELDWKALINSHWREDTLFSLDFLKRYQQYISVENLEESALWDSIIDEAVESIKKDMIFGK
jgi:hypothetical protein